VELDAPYLGHRRCGELEVEISEEEPSWVVSGCRGGAQLPRRL